MAKKLNCIIVAITVLMVAVAGNYVSAKKVTLTHWGWGTMLDAIKPAIERYEKSHPNVSIKPVHMTMDDARDKFFMSLAAGVGAPDVMFVDEQFGSKVYNLGGFVDLTDKVKNYKEAFCPYYVDVFTFKGKLLSIPWDGGPSSIFWRKDIFDEVGVKFPDNWQDFIEVGKKITGTRNAKGQKRWMTYFWQGDMFEQWIHGRGGIISNKRGEILFDNPLVIDTLRWYTDAILKHKIANYADDSSPATYTMLKEDRYAAACFPIWYAGSRLKRFAYTPKFEGKWRVSPWLPWKKGDPSTGAIWGGSGVALPTQSKHQKEALDYMLYLTTNVESQVEIAAEGKFPLYIPAIKALFEKQDPFFGGQKLYPLYYKQLLKTPVFNRGPNGTLIRDAFTRAIDYVVTKGMSAEEAIHKVSEEAKKEAKIY